MPTTLKVTKTYGDSRSACHARAWYARRSAECKPLGMIWDDDTCTYDFVQGSYPTDLAACHESLRRHVWDSSTPASVLNVGMFITHVLNAASRCDVQDMMNMAYKVCSKTLEYASHATPVHDVHGDATLENTVQTCSGIVFLDPGHDRGMPCRELDESKMMQSLLGYDHIKHQHPVWPKETKTPFEVKPLHYALLCTHLIRLIPHQSAAGRDDVVAWAMEELKKIGARL